MGAFSISHWAIVLLVVLLVFGPKKLAGLGATRSSQATASTSEAVSSDGARGGTDAAPPALGTPFLSESEPPRV